MVVFCQQRRDLEGIVELVPADEVVGADDRRAAFPWILRTRELVEDIPVLVRQIATDDVRRGAIDEIPVVDAVVTTQIQREQRLSVLRARAPRASLEVHDAHGAHAYLV